MKKQINIVLLIVIGLLLFGAGVFGGVLLEKNVITLNKNSSAPGTSTIVGAVNAGLIPWVAVNGQVVKISGKNITLDSQGKNFTIPISADAKIYTPSPAGAPTQSKFEDIKLGNFLDISLKILPDGTFEGQDIGISPSL